MASRSPVASVIVPMQNAESHVLEQVAALTKQTGSTDFEVIWVDNGSSDGTVPIVADAIRGDDRMRIVSAPEVKCSYFARNRGVEVASGDLLLFCDADDVVGSNWVASMTSALADLDVVGGALRQNLDDDAVVPSEPAFGFLPAAPTSNLGVRRAAFDALGGFDSFMPSGEDFALCWRAQLRGFRFGFAPDSVVYWRRRSTERQRMKRIWTYGRWYPVWVAPYVPFGAEHPTVRRAFGRLVTQVVVPGLKHPRRDYARAAVWHLGVISSAVWKPKRPSA